MINKKDIKHKYKQPNLLFDLPSNIIGLIFEYDDTYHIIYKQLIQEIKLFPVWNVTYLKDEVDTINHTVYYCKKIAKDMLCHWNNHYTSFIDSLLNYQTNTYHESRTLVNYLDTNQCGSAIPGRKETIFQWINYYNTIISK